MKTMTAIINCFVIFFAFCSILWCSVDGAPDCGTPLDIDLTKCVYGTARDWCHRHVCAQGPGEICGGYHNELGTCGNGLYCLCNQCSGCSTLTLKCHELRKELC